jgi:hypothetical protein
MRAMGDECSRFERSGDGRLQGGRAPAPASLAEQPTGTRGEGKAEALTEPGVLGAGKENGGSPKGGKAPAAGPWPRNALRRESIPGSHGHHSLRPEQTLSASCPYERRCSTT